MASFSNYFFAVSFAIFIFFASAQKTTKPINDICKQVTNKPFCLQKLKAYRPAATATTTLKAADATLKLVIAQAMKSAVYAKTAAIKNRNLRKQFAECQSAFQTVISSLRSAALELRIDPDTANYDVMVCTDSTTIVKNLVRRNTDKASKTIMRMTATLEKLIRVAAGATVAVGG